jgi:putative ATPase
VTAYEQQGWAGAPLAVRLRPRDLDEIAGQTRLLGAGSPLRNLASADSGTSVSVILWGPPGTGKTSIAHAIAIQSGRKFAQLSAITAGVKDVREVMEKARAHRELYGEGTLLFLDEIHRFSKAQQDALLPGVENGWVTLIAATTENPSFSVISPLLSRSLLLTLELLSNDELSILIDKALSLPHGFNGKYSCTPDALSALLAFASGDARRALTSLEAATSIADAHSTQVITVEYVEAAVDRALLRYDRQGDEHYDVVSAFIKSIRGSDADAAIHYLARMLEAGEDPRFIARRLIISAAEDIGLASPQALEIATAASEAVALIGMPEGRIPLAEATIYLALAPKSNAAYSAINAAISDVQAGHSGPVPPHLRDGNYSGAKRLGHGKGYVYAHDAAHAVAQQQYLPDALVGTEYYVPTDRGHESEIGSRLAKLRKLLRGESL